MDKKKLKEAYGLEKLSFYRKGAQFCCHYSDADDKVDIFDLDFILKSLSAQQCAVYFDDVGEVCTGIDELKQKYLIFRLAGL